MKVLNAEFVTSSGAGGAGTVPRDGLPRIAMAGRSNVGKSTLINALCRRTIARTSAAPGKTRLANFYRVTLEGGGGPGRWALYLVDLPGYGYARGGADAAAELRAVAEEYFKGILNFSPDIRKDKLSVPASVLLVDARHPGLESDLEAASWLESIGVHRHIVATKIDKLSRSERARNVKALETSFGTAVLPVSAASGEGMDELWKLIVGIARGASRA